LTTLHFRGMIEAMTEDPFEESKKAIMDLLTRKEDLHEDLKPYLYDHPTLSAVLQHPLVYSVPHSPMFNAHMNRMYENKKKAVAEAIAEGKWSQYISLHERAWRLNALLEIRGSMNDVSYWEEVGDVWTDSENIYQNIDDWRDIWDEDRPERQNCMNAKERVRLSKLSKTLKVYRGVCHEESIHGLSWTTDINTAKWFARRFARPKEGLFPTLVTGSVNREDVLACFLGRNENEIVAFPEAVTIKSIKTVEPVNA